MSESSEVHTVGALASHNDPPLPPSSHHSMTTLNAPPNSTSTSGGIQKKRRRPALSCEQCRNRKVKCDRNEPCSTCIKSKIASSCTYVPTHTPPSWLKKNRPTNKSIGTASSSRASSKPFILPASDRNVQAPSQDVGAISKPTPPSRGITPDRQCSSFTYTADDSGIEKVDWLAARVHHLEEKLSRVVTLGQESEDHESTQGTEFSVPAKATVSKTRYFGRSHWMNGAAMVKHSSFLSSPYKTLYRPD